MLLNRRAVDVCSIHCEAAKIDLGGGGGDERCPAF
jgi:hypothetical protein